MSSSTSGDNVVPIGLDDPPMFVKRSTSGATIIGTRDTVFKIAEPKSPTLERIRQQGLWLSRHNVPELPIVLKTFDVGYAMPRYHRRTLSPTDGCVYIIDALSKVWGLVDTDYTPRFSPDSFVGYVTYVGQWLGLSDAARLSQTLVTSVDGWFECTVHGDPTLDNLMMDHNGRHVLTDPIPYHRYMPSVAVSDLGKVIQSVWGYESIIESGGAAPTPDRETVYEYIAERFGRMALHDARAFAVLHMLRLIPFQESLGHRAAVRQFKEITRHELDNLYL